MSLDPEWAGELSDGMRTHIIRCISKCGIKLSNSIAKDAKILTLEAQECAGGDTWVDNSGHFPRCIHAQFVTHPVMIRSVPVSSSGLGSGTQVLIRWVLTHHYLVAHFSLTQCFPCFMQLEGGSSQKSSHFRRDMTEKIINSILLYKSQQ